MITAVLTGIIASYQILWGLFFFVPGVAALLPLKSLEITVSALGVMAIGLMLIVAGIGLTRRKLWGRQLSLMVQLFTAIATVPLSLNNARMLLGSRPFLLTVPDLNLDFGPNADRFLKILEDLYFNNLSLTQKSILVIPFILAVTAILSVLFLRQPSLKNWLKASQRVPDSFRVLTVDLLLQEAAANQHYRVVSRMSFITVIAGLLVFFSFQNNVDFIDLVRNYQNMVDYVTRYFPMSYTDWSLYVLETVETVGMGLWGTLLAAIVGVPLGILGSCNIFPNWVVFPIRRLMDAMRAINEVVFALICIVAVGLGPFAGILALAIHTAGTLGKLFSEAIESIEPGPVDGIRATGASKFQEIVFGVLPQVFPLWISYTLYRFEANIRSASVLGIVGAGGIGVSLYQSFSTFEYQKVCTILLILVVTVSCIDLLSSKLRSYLT